MRRHIKEKCYCAFSSVLLLWQLKEQKHLFNCRAGFIITMNSLIRIRKGGGARKVMKTI